MKGPGCDNSGHSKRKVSKLLPVDSPGVKLWLI